MIKARLDSLNERNRIERKIERRIEQSNRMVRANVWVAYRMLRIAQKEIAESIADVAGVKYEEALASLEIPQHFGDLCSKIAFTLASTKKANPAKIAAEIVSNLGKAKIRYVERIEAKGPYINLYFSDEFYAEALKEMLTERGEFGKLKKTNKRIVVEFFHANTHKGVHIGHIRNISLGESLSRLLEFTGNDVIRANYQGDIGPHVAKCLWGFINLYHEKAPEERKGVWLGKVYSEASKKVSGNKELEGQVQEINLKLYSKDKKISEAWKKTRQWCLDDFEEFYKEFGTKFDALYFESQVERLGKETALDFLKQGIAKKDQGAVIMDLKDDGLGVYVLLTKEGYPLYYAKELGLVQLQFDKYNPDRLIHVVGKEQELYFKQLFKTFEKAGEKGDALFEKAAKASYHLIYELVMLPEGKMSSREGTMVLYEDLKEKLMEIVKQEVKKRHENWSESVVEETAMKIALAAIKFSMLRRESNRTLVFDWDEALNLEGDSGPYLQYAHVRTMGILRKADYKPDVRKGYLFNENEKALIKKLCEFPVIVEKCAGSLTPHSFVDYMVDVAMLLNKFYTTSPVLTAEKEEERETRLAIVSATSGLLKTGLFLLGIECPERM